MYCSLLTSWRYIISGGGHFYPTLQRRSAPTCRGRCPHNSLLALCVWVGSLPLCCIPLCAPNLLPNGETCFSLLCLGMENVSHFMSAAAPPSTPSTSLTSAYIPPSLGKFGQTFSYLACSIACVVSSSCPHNQNLLPIPTLCPTSFLPKHFGRICFCECFWFSTFSW